MQEAYNFIKGIIKDRKDVVAAISGGPDSMLLLNILHNISIEEKTNIVVAHVNHNVRKESEYEAEQLKKICEEYNFRFEFLKINSYSNNRFSEVEARKIRYDFFDEVIKKYNADILFTAHHADDLMETILMRISRGSTIRGYAGFKRISNDRGYIITKPLINLTKEDICKELNKINIWYAVDKSNSDTKYTRNRYRKNILPLLKKENKNIHLKYRDFSERLLLVDEYIKKRVIELSNSIIKDEKIVVDIFNEQDSIIKIYILEDYIKKIYKDNITKLSSKHIEEIINLLLSKSNFKINLPLNKVGICEYNSFYISEIKSKHYEYTFTDKIELSNGHKIIMDNSTSDTSNYAIHLYSKDIKLPFHVRTRKDGDKMSVKNLHGTKKISDILTDSKISKRIRDEYPIVTDDSGDIIWIPGVKKSQFDRKNDEKCDIILRYI